MVNGRRADFKEVLDINRGMAPGAWDLKHLPGKLVEAVKEECERMKSKREREALEKVVTI